MLFEFVITESRAEELELVKFKVVWMGLNLMLCELLRAEIRPDETAERGFGVGWIW